MTIMIIRPFIPDLPWDVNYTGTLGSQYLNNNKYYSVYSTEYKLDSMPECCHLTTD